MSADDWRARTCLAGHKIYPDGPTWCCNLRKGHDGPHDDGLGSQWTDEPERSDAIDQAILRGLVDRRIEVEGPDFDHADESLIAHAKSVRAAIEQAELSGRTCDALCRDVEEDRDRLLAEVERLRAVADAAIAWRRRVAKAQRAGHRWTAGPQHWADGADLALIEAVDALDTAGTAPAAGGEAGR